MNIAINSEASIMIHRDGWYYLIVTHGSCCAGANSSYNLRMGRSRRVTGPFLDNMGIDMLQGGGKLFFGSGGRQIGAGHFGLLDLGDGVQKFSLHFEADLDRGGISVLDIRPLLWRDGWPVAGENVREGIYQIESARTGTRSSCEDGRSGHAGGRSGGGGGAGGPAGRARRAQVPGAPLAEPRRRAPRRWIRRTTHSLARCRAGLGRVAIASGGRALSPYMLQAQQKWAITPVAGVGGYPDRRSSRSPSPAPIGPSRPRPIANWPCDGVHGRRRSAVAH